LRRRDRGCDATRATDLLPGVDTDVQMLAYDRVAGTKRLVSGTPAGGRSDGEAAWDSSPWISPTGRYIAFDSTALDIVAGDTNSRDDVFVRDMVLGKTARISLSSTGAQLDGHSAKPALSADGSLAAFESMATNAVPSDTNGAQDVFLRTKVVPVAASKPVATLSPSATKTTVKRKRGKATFTRKLTLRDVGALPMAGVRVWLETSKNGKKWTKKYRLATNASGLVSKKLAAKRKGTTYYRWYVPASENYSALTTKKQSVKVK
jgi:hypothetical protein